MDKERRAVFLRKIIAIIKSRKYELLLFFFILLYIIIFSTWTILRHWAYKTTAYDLGLFDQALWSTLHGRVLYVSFDPSHTPLAFHTQFILFLILPIYYLFPYPETLLVIQTVALGIGALGVYLVAKEILKDKAFALALAVSYLLYPPLHGINRFDFHPDALATPFILFSFYYILRRRYGIAFFFSFLSLTCKEDAAFAMFSFGLYIIGSKIGIRLKRKPRLSSLLMKRDILWALAFLLSSIIYFYIAVFYFIPMLHPSGRYPHWERYGGQKIDINSLISNLKYEIDLKFLYTFLLLAPIMFFPLLDSGFLLLAAPYFAEYLLSRVSLHYTIGYEYPYALIPFNYIAASRGLKKLFPNIKQMPRIVKTKLLGCLLLVSLGSTLLYSPTPFGVFNDPLNFIVTDESWYTPDIRTRALDKIISIIPENASVATQNDILPHMAHRFNVYLDYKEGVDYILVDSHSPWIYGPYLPFCPLPNRKISKELLEKYGILVSIDGIFLFKENYTGAPLNPILIGIINGLKARFYSNMDFDGDPVYTEYILTLDINWAYSSPFITVPNNYFSAIIEGYIYIKEDGNYTFRLKSDDGSNLYIDDILIINGSGPLAIDIEQTMYLSKGYHKIRIEYTEYSGTATIKLEWKTPYKAVYEVIPPKYLFIDLP